MGKIFEFLVNQQEIGERLDKFLASKLKEKTRSAVQKLIEENCFTINNKSNFNKNYRVHAGDLLKIVIPDPSPVDIIPQNIPLDIPYEDSDLLIVNKPQGMVVHPAVGHHSGTLVNALLFYLGDAISTINSKIRPGIVHRIDKDTSGLLIVAKNDSAQLSLAEQIKNHTFTREYEAVAHNSFKLEAGKINAPVGRDIRNRKKMCVTQKNSKSAITEYHILKNYAKFAHVRLRLHTGRTHQIRVHMAYIHHPLAGDPVYGPKHCAEGLKGQCLHAKLIGFFHPKNGKYIEIESALPNYFTEFLKHQENQSANK
ncbi:MAG: RluA family pseudouridine synthase [Oscillospiraceae bacterium]|jgi:23S rRNA pseudouridine1911/1915/1917 synthase|nr:RluA family pseudouridine synthase [Oscillospiraceae bacterium]